MVDNRANRIPPAERRAEIVSCAIDLFAAKGFVVTTMDDIAEKANITKRTLYRYFASKDELLFEIHDSFSGHAWAEDHSSKIEDPRTALEAVINEHVHLVCDHTTAIRVFFEERKHLTPQRAAAVDARRDIWEAYATSVVEAGQADRHFRQIPAWPATQLILGSMTDMYRWYRPSGQFSPGKLATLYSDQFFHGIARDRFGSLPNVEVAGTQPEKVGDVRNKARVREAATEAFALQGYHATSMRHLADLADVTKGAVMYHAGYKQDLLAEIIRVTFEEGLQAIEEATWDSADNTAAEILYKVVHAQIEYAAHNPYGVAVVNDNLRFLEPKARRQLDRIRGQWLDAIAAPLLSGLENGEFDHPDSAFLTRTLVGMLNSVSRWYRLGGSLTAVDLTNVLVELLLSGLEAPQEEQRR